MKKLILVFLSICLILTACSRSDGGRAAVTQGRTDLNMVTQVNPDSLDPQGTTMLYSSQVYKNIFATLMRFDANNNLVPCIAESFTSNENSTVFNVTLRRGIRFHNGEELKASDVVYTMNRGKNHPFSPMNYPLIERAEVLGDYEVRFTLVRPYAPFLGVLATPGFAILSEKATEELGDSFGRNPVGCGPYRFVSWADGENIRLSAFDEYFEGPPAIKDVTIRFIADQNTALIALETGDVDYSYVFPESAKPDIASSNNLKLQYFDSTALQFLTLNHDLAPLSNKLVRQAINLASNRDDIITVAVEGEGRPTSLFANVNTFGYMDMPGYPHDVQRARALMAEAGYANGFSVTATAQDAMTRRVVEVFASNMSQIGINVTIEVLESNTAVRNFMTGNYEIGMLGINNAMLDLDFLKVLFEPNGPLNLANHNNQELYDKFLAAAEPGNSARRLELYREINETLLDLAIYVPFFFPLRAHTMNANLSITHIGGSSIAEIYDMSWN